MGGALTCGTKGGSAACQCLDNPGTTVYVDPNAGSDMAAGLLPDGRAVARRVPLSARSRRASSKITAGGTVIAISATLPATFGSETFPLAVPAGTTLTTADAVATPADYKILFGTSAASAATAVMWKPAPR